MVGVWDVADYGQCPDGELFDAVVFVVADDEYPVLAAAAD
jgi:hypothetical protein